MRLVGLKRARCNRVVKEQHGWLTWPNSSYYCYSCISGLAMLHPLHGIPFVGTIVMRLIFVGDYTKG